MAKDEKYSWFVLQYCKIQLYIIHNSVTSCILKWGIFQKCLLEYWIFLSYFNLSISFLNVSLPNYTSWFSLMIQKTPKKFWILSLIVFDIFMLKHCRRFVKIRTESGLRKHEKKGYILKKHLLKKAKIPQQLLFMFKLWTTTFVCKSEIKTSADLRWSDPVTLSTFCILSNHNVALSL